MEKHKTTHLKLPFQFDEHRLVYDLNLILKKEWSSMLYKHNYDGNWSSVALYAPNGDSTNIFSHSEISEKLIPTEILKECKYLPQVIESFKSKILTARLLRLSVGSVIKPHKDYKMGYEDGNCRIHIPLTTNNSVSFILDDQKLRLLPGECWYINANYTHSVSNLGNEDRIHLVIDIERNNWTDDLFFSLAPKESLVDSNPIDPQILKEMISNLERLDNGSNNDIIDQYKKQLYENS